jgi:DNA-binding NtrC family response regulator
MDHVESYWEEQQKVAEQFLQDSLVFPVGATEAYGIDLRFIFVGRGQYPEGWARPDRMLPSLWQRLKAHTLMIPPLRERREDIRTLLFYELNRIRDNDRAEGRRERELPILEEEALDYIQERRLPGNGWDLRRLANTVNFVPPGKVITCDLLQELLRFNQHDLDRPDGGGFKPSRRVPRFHRRATRSWRSELGAPPYLE